MAISIPTVVDDYITGVVNALTTGSELDNPPNDPATIRAAAQNYLRAQDAATIVELLSDLVVTGELTAVGGSTTTVVDGADTFVAGVWVGATVTFEADTTTAAIQGLSRVVVANSTTTLTLGEALPAAVVNTDTYTINFGTAVDSLVDAVRQGTGLADSPRGSVYSDARTVDEMFNRLSLVVTGSVIPARSGYALPAGAYQIPTVHPAGQPGDNLYYGYMIDFVRDAVAAYTLPT